MVPVVPVSEKHIKGLKPKYKGSIPFWHSSHPNSSAPPDLKQQEILLTVPGIVYLFTYPTEQCNKFFLLFTPWLLPHHSFLLACLYVYLFWFISFVERCEKLYSASFVTSLKKFLLFFRAEIPGPVVSLNQLGPYYCTYFFLATQIIA